MPIIEDAPSASSVSQPNPVDAARVAIWRLFQEGYVDEDMATAGLLAVDLGTRRARRGATAHADTGRAKERQALSGRTGSRVVAPGVGAR